MIPFPSHVAPGLAAWGGDVGQRLQQLENPQGPSGLWAVAYGDLPDAATYQDRVVWVSDLGVVARSDGTAWLFSAPPSERTRPTLSTAGSSATISVSAGAVLDDAGEVVIPVAAISKTTSAWAVGSGNGGLLSGSIATNTFYHLFAIWGSAGSDVGFSTSLSPTLPTGYTHKAYLGSRKTNGSSQWVKFTQIGRRVILDTPVRDVAGVTVGTTSPADYVLASVPPGVNVVAQVTVSAIDSTQRVASAVYSKLSPTQSAGSPTGNYNLLSSGANQTAGADFDLVTDTTQKITYAADGANVALTVITRGWIEP